MSYDTDDGYDAYKDGILERGGSLRHTSPWMRQRALAAVTPTPRQLGYAKSLLAKAMAAGKLTDADSRNYGAALAGSPTRRQVSRIIDTLKGAS